MKSEVPYAAEPQVEPEHYLFGYDNAGRWASYYHQIGEVSESDSRTVLEVGPGNGTVTDYLSRVLGIEMTTVDIDARLQPDVLADVAEMPFSDKAFDFSLACEVLEHVPIEHAVRGLKELRRVSERALVSVPNANRYYFQVFLGFGSRRRRILQLDLSRFMPRPMARRHGEHQHYWELNRGTVTVKDFQGMLMEAGWSIDRQYRNPDYPSHHFFVLS